jgi:hypothetical protein
MTPAPLLDSPRTTSPLTTRFTLWGRWLFFLLLMGNVIVCHGCHSDEDNELCAPPPIRARSVSDGRGAMAGGTPALRGAGVPPAIANAAGSDGS